MATNQTNKLVWLIKTIHNAKKITFEELNRKWKDNIELSGGEDLVKRTFHKWKTSIFETFGLIVECEKNAPFCYYIENADDMKHGSIENWLISTYSVSNSLAESKSIKDRILLEEIPSGREYLASIIDAVKNNRFIHITYYNYWRGEPRQHYVMPLCVKLFRQRWYMVGREWPTNEDLVFCLDRIKNFRLSSHSFEYPEDFKPKEFFDGCFGVIPEKNCKIEEVVLKVSAGQANYLRDLPLHPSQKETEMTEDYSVFKLRVRPTYDLQQEIFWNMDNVEVLEPKWFRDEIKGVAKRILANYKNK